MTLVYKALLRPHVISFQSLNLGGRRGTTDDVATIVKIHNTYWALVSFQNYEKNNNVLEPTPSSHIGDSKAKILVFFTVLL